MILVALLALARAEAPLEWRAQAGAEVNASPFGIMDIGVRNDRASLELRTDTLDVRWQPEDERGRRWVAARLELGAGGLLLGPWTDGAPDPSRALTASYLGVEAGRLRYGPDGLYGGFAWAARGWWFGARADTLIEVPGPRPVITADGVWGWYTPAAHAWVRAGVDAMPDRLSPHAHLDLRARGPWSLSPALELRAGLAEGQDFLTTTRLGGLNPYVVPLAGAGWAEWWVEDYVAARLALDLRREALDAALFVDAAAFDGEQALGLGGSAGVRRGALHASLALGWAPWIDRAPGVGRGSAFFMLGRGWAPSGSS